MYTLVLTVKSKNDAGDYHEVTNTEFSYAIEIKYEPCRFTTLNANSVELTEMRTNARDTTIVEQSFDDVRDYLCVDGDINACCGDRVYEVENADAYAGFLTVDVEARPVTLSMLALSDADAGTYEINIIASLKDWADAGSVSIPLLVEVLPCTPLTLEPSAKPADIALAIAADEEGEFVATLPVYE